MIWSVMALVWLQLLTWGTFLTLPYAARYDKKTGTLSTAHVPMLWALYRTGNSSEAELDVDQGTERWRRGQATSLQRAKRLDEKAVIV